MLNFIMEGFTGDSSCLNDAKLERNFYGSDVPVSTTTESIKML